MTEKEMIQLALNNWLPRFHVAHVDIQDIIENVRPNCETWRQWYAAMDQRGDMHKKLGDEAVKAGNKYTAGQAYALAATYYHFGKYVLYLEPDLYKEGTKKTIETYRLAAPLLDPPAERLVIKVGSYNVYAYLRKPNGVKNPPVVFCIPGSDSVKEEFCYLEEIFLNRGMATLSIDGPGQGETREECALDMGEYKKAMSKVIDYLDSRSDLAHRYGTCGISLGAPLAFICAGTEHRFTALTGNGGPFKTLQMSELKAITKLSFMHIFGTKTDEELLKALPSLDVTEAGKTITCPSLFVMGGKDTVILPENAIGYKSVPNCEYVLYPEGNHVCNNIPFKYRPLVADWLKKKLEA